jgi:hypothetical protein
VAGLGSAAKASQATSAARFWSWVQGGPRAFPQAASWRTSSLAVRPRAARVLLVTYWVVASLASVWVLHRLSWPAWASSILEPLALALVPLGYGAFLRADRLTEWVALLLRPLLAEPTSEPD